VKIKKDGRREEGKRNSLGEKKLETLKKQ